MISRAQGQPPVRGAGGGEAHGKTEPAAPANPASPASLAEEGERIYTGQLRGKLEPEHVGEFVAIHPETGAYFRGATGTEGLSKAHSTMPAARFYLKKVGSETAHKT